MEAGELIDERYRLIRSIGEGGFGAVWLAQELGLERPVAIKFLKRDLDREELVRFQREVAALARLADEHILTLYNVGEHAGSRYIATEYLDGLTLNAWKPRSIEDIVAVATQIAAALAAAHREGVVHRDLKPANIIVLSGHDSAPFVKVLDLGIAKLAGGKQLDITKTGDVIGTPGFMSPEQLRGVSDIGPATDLYNLGVILWELIEGRPMFTGGSALEISMQHLVNPAPPVTMVVPPHLAQLLPQLLSKDPRRRGSAAAIVRTLRSGVVPEPATPGPADSTFGVRGFALIAAVVALIVVLLVLVLPPTSEAPVTKARTDTSRGERFESLNHNVSQETAIDPPVTSRRRALEGGCGVSWEPGQLIASSRAIREHTATGLSRDDDQSIIVVPENYDPQRRSSVTVLLGDGSRSPTETLQEARTLVESAGRDRGIVVAVEGGRHHAVKRLTEPGIDTHKLYIWEGRLHDVPALVDVVARAFCVDSNRVFLVGDGRGGRAAEKLLHDTTLFAAVAMTDYRRKGRDLPGEGTSGGEDFRPAREPIPTLWITSQGSLRTPLDGKHTDCLKKYDLVPHAEEQAQFLSQQACQGKPKSDGKLCKTWDCEVPFVSCLTRQGRHWPDYAGKIDRCNQPSEFDYGAKIWDFFKNVASPKPSAGCSRRPRPIDNLTFITKQNEPTGPTGFVIQPVEYDPTRPHRLIVALHQGKQEPVEMVNMLRNLAELADKHRAIIMVPVGARTKLVTQSNIAGRPWTAPRRVEFGLPTPLDDLPDQIAEVTREFCVDENEMFVMGHGAGAHAALLLEERMQTFSGVAVTGYTREPGEHEFPLKESKAPLWFAHPTDSPRQPVTGDVFEQCNQRANISRDDLHEDFRKHYRCDKTSVESTHSGGTCAAFCNGDYVMCEVEGGRRWSTVPRRGACDGPQPTFDYAGRIWAFFDEVSQKP